MAGGKSSIRRTTFSSFERSQPETTKFAKISASKKRCFGKFSCNLRLHKRKVALTLHSLGQKIMRKRSNPDSEQNIKRIDTKPRAKKQTHGFQVHFVRGSSSGTRMFSDAVYGGKDSALKAARKYRKEVMGDLPARTTLSSKAKTAGKSAAKKTAAKKNTARR